MKTVNSFINEKHFSNYCWRSEPNSSSNSGIRWMRFVCETLFPIFRFIFFVTNQFGNSNESMLLHAKFTALEGIARSAPNTIDSLCRPENEMMSVKYWLLTAGMVFHCKWDYSEILRIRSVPLRYLSLHIFLNSGPDSVQFRVSIKIADKKIRRHNLLETSSLTFVSSSWPNRHTRGRGREKG